MTLHESIAKAFSRMLRYEKGIDENGVAWVRHKKTGAVGVARVLTTDGEAWARLIDHHDSNRD